MIKQPATSILIVIIVLSLFTTAYADETKYATEDQVNALLDCCCEYLENCTHTTPETIDVYEGQVTYLTIIHSKSIEGETNIDLFNNYVISACDFDNAGIMLHEYGSLYNDKYLEAVEKIRFCYAIIINADLSIMPIDSIFSITPVAKVNGLCINNTSVYDIGFCKHIYYDNNSFYAVIDNNSIIKITPDKDSAMYKEFRKGFMANVPKEIYEEWGPYQ